MRPHRSWTHIVLIFDRDFPRQLGKRFTYFLNGLVTRDGWGGVNSAACGPSH